MPGVIKLGRSQNREFIMPAHFDREQWKARVAQERNLSSLNGWETCGELFGLELFHRNFVIILSDLCRLVNDIRISKGNETYNEIKDRYCWNVPWLSGLRVLRSSLMCGKYYNWKASLRQVFRYYKVDTIPHLSHAFLSTPMSKMLLRSFERTFIGNPVPLSDGHCEAGLLADNKIILIRLDRLTVSRLRGNGRWLRVARGLTGTRCPLYDTYGINVYFDARQSTIMQPLKRRRSSLYRECNEQNDAHQPDKHSRYHRPFPFFPFCAQC